MPKKQKIKFHVNPLELYDGVISPEQWPIGIRASYPEDLLKNITASSIACFMGIKSVDYTRKQYLENWSKDGVGLDDEKPDFVTVHTLKDKVENLQDYLTKNSHNVKCSSTQKIADITLLKTLGTIIVALNLASKGLLHEVLVLSRASLEMISWSYKIFDLSGSEKPFDYKPEKTLSGFKEIYPLAGKYYGYLSEHSHWYPNTHRSAVNINSEQIEVIYASGRNKWESISNIFLILLLHSKTYFTRYKKLNCKKGCSNLSGEVKKTHDDLCVLFEKWIKLFHELDKPYVSLEFAKIISDESTKNFIQRN